MFRFRVVLGLCFRHIFSVFRVRYNMFMVGFYVVCEALWYVVGLG